MRRFKGYMTLEATFIVPMIICVFALLIYFSYYLYGRCVLSQDTYILAFRASVADERAHGDAVTFVSEKAPVVVGKKYFGSTLPRFKTTVDGKDIRVHGYSEARHSAMGRYFLKPRSGWDYEAAGRARRFEYVSHIRKLTRLRDLGKEIMDQIGDK